MSEPYARIDYLKYSDMRRLNELVTDVGKYARNNPQSDCENYVRQIVEEIEDLFGGRVGQFEYVEIVQILRRFATCIARIDEPSNRPNATTITSDIIKIVRGDKKMDKNKLTAMIFRRVMAALEKLDEHRCSNCYTTSESPKIEGIAEEYAGQIFNDVFGGEVPLKADFVDQYYEMDPKTEDVLHNGSLIHNGMTVLVEDPNYRVQISGTLSVDDLARARLRNRWCTVEESKVIRRSDTPLLEFIGVYEGGVKRKWSIPTSWAWIVRKDSIPRVDQVLDPGGNVAWTGPAADLLKLFKKTHVSYHARYSVMIGGSDITMPGDQYILSEGEVMEPGHVWRKAPIDEAEVFDPDGLSVLSGTVEDLLAWAQCLPSDSKYLDYRLRYAGYDKLTTVHEFLVTPMWNGQE